MIKKFMVPSKKMVFFGIISIILAGVFLSFSLRKNDKIISINSKSNIDYSVHLNENSFYETDVLPGNMEYIASLIKYIDTNLTYKIESSDVMNYDYVYSIEAITRVYGDKSKNNILFEKKEIIKDEQKVNVQNRKDTVINENIKVDYGKYNELIALFKSSYLLESNSDVKIVLHVKANVSDSNYFQTNGFSEDVAIVIPLTEQTVSIKLSEQPAGMYKVIEGSNKVINNYSTFALSIVFFIIFVLFISIYFIYYIKMDKVTFLYRKTLKKILRDYDLIIVNLKDAFDERDYKVIEVTSFEELKDVHDNIGNPILFKEVIKYNRSVFVVTDNNTLYKFVLKK